MNKTNNQVATNQVPENQAETAQAAVAAQPVVEEVKKYIVNCYRCGAALNVKAGNMVYMCPVCNNLFRVRLGEKLVKDISRIPGAEAYASKGVRK